MNRSRQEVNQLISHHGLLPLFNPDNLEVCKDVIRSAYQGGVRLFECTNRSANALSIFQALIPWALREMPDLLIGAGTIMDKEAARNFHEAGAQFIVSPVITPEVADYCAQNNLLWCPGAGSLNEIIHAHQLGADIVKIFPANFLGGPGFVKAIKAPCPWIRVMPTGGVEPSEENLRAWFDAGVISVGIGSQLFTQKILAARDFDSLTALTRKVVQTIKSIKAAET